MTDLAGLIDPCFGDAMEEMQNEKEVTLSQNIEKDDELIVASETQNIQVEKEVISKEVANTENDDDQVDHSEEKENSDYVWSTSLGAITIGGISLVSPAGLVAISTLAVVGFGIYIMRK
ncbi:MAG: hypothetical protein DGJ47_000302 [Rickettsiaceae bacterium]